MARDYSERKKNYFMGSLTKLTCHFKRKIYFCYVVVNSVAIEENSWCKNKLSSMLRNSICLGLVLLLFCFFLNVEYFWTDPHISPRTLLKHPGHSFSFIAKWFSLPYFKWASFPCKAILGHKNTAILIKYIDSLRTLLDLCQKCDPPIWAHLAEAIPSPHYYLEFIVHEIGCSLLFYQNKYKD